MFIIKFKELNLKCTVLWKGVNTETQYWTKSREYVPVKCSPTRGPLCQSFSLQDTGIIVEEAVRKMVGFEVIEDICKAVSSGHDQTTASKCS